MGDVRRKTRWVALLLIVVLLLATGNMSYAASPAGSGPQEMQVTERDDGRLVDLRGQVLVLKLESNPSTGYRWQVQGLDGRLLRQLDIDEWVPYEEGKLGGSGTQVLRFAGMGKGLANLNLVYARSWESAPPARTYSLKVRVIEPSEDVSYPQPVDEGPAEAAPDAAAAALPAAYNWCSLGGCTDVRDQGNCGSCWAFATVGAVETNILIKDGAAKDLAEQWLVSCNTDGYGCDGGWWAHKYFVSPGAVYEADFPYTATDAPCGGPYTYHEKIASWAYVGNSSSVPSTTAIKQAIYDHGPVSAGVCVNNTFKAYTGGVFSPTGWCLSINHGITLVGWDDSVGAWILRNSWGDDWGESGYMRIAYGKYYVGYAAAYVVYNGSLPPTPPTAPTGLTATAASYSQINLTWTDTASTETGFKIERCTGADCTDFAQIATAGANVGSYANTGLDPSTSYSYRVRAYNTAGDSDYSNTASATTQALPAPPAAPTNLAASAVSNSQINLTWADNSGDETGFKIERCAGVDCTSFAQITTVAANATSYSNTGLTASTSYSYRVRAYNAGGDSDYSNSATAVTQAAPTVPNAPTNLIATAASRSQINLTWTDNATNETGFKIERCRGSTCSNFSQIGTVGANVTSYASTGLSSNTTYRYRVRAYNAAGNSTYSNIATATTLRR